MARRGACGASPSHRCLSMPEYRRATTAESRGIPDDAFARLLGRQASTRERERLHRLREELNIKSNDALWLLLIGLQYHVTLFEEMPARIELAAEKASLGARRLVLATGTTCALILVLTTVISICLGHR